MKSNRVMMAAAMMTTIGGAEALAKVLEQDASERRAMLTPEPIAFGPGTGEVPEGFGPTERDKARMAAAEEKRARCRARNLSNSK